MRSAVGHTNMEAKQRDSFETLDLTDLEDAPDATESESGLRRLPGKPPPLPRPNVSAPPPTGAVSERVDLDALVAHLSTSADLLEAPRAAGLAAPLLATPERRTPYLAWAGGAAVVLAAVYLGGVATSRLWEPSAPAPRVATSPLIEQPVIEQPVIEQPVIEAPVIEAPVIEAPTTLEPITITAAQPDEAVRDEEVPTTTPAPTRIVPPRAVADSSRTEASDRAPAISAAAPTLDPPVVLVADVPDVPSREDVRAALAAVTPPIEACGGDADVGRIARVRFTFASHGRVVHALATGVSGPTASCIAAAARGARIAPFARESFAVEYPFPL